MKKYLISLSIILTAFLVSTKSNAQCAYDNTLYLSGAAPTVVGSTIIGDSTWGGDFNRVFNMQAGYTYEISTCNTPTFDSELTIYPAGGGTAVAHDDDGCGLVGGSSKIIFIPTTTGDYDILLDEYGCVSNNIDMSMEITLISTGGGGSNVLNIPVVVHVVYKNASENISDAQIMSQINVLNNDYRKLNADFSQLPAVFQPLGADMNIQFCLASVDPNGNPTSGITRTPTTTPVFSHSTEVKFSANGGIGNWNPEQYLNMWVCDLDGGLLGYATFPDDLAASPQEDGVVIDYEYFGTFNTTAPYDLGRTATHEVGHWLNLKHIWGDAACGDDFVSDTPTQETSNGGCPTFPHVTCGNGTNGDLFYDYMDYSNDACLLLFTNGQKQRTDATIAIYRSGLTTSPGCGAATGIAQHNKPVSFQVYPNPSSTQMTIQFAKDEKYEVSIFDLTGKNVFNQTSDKSKLTIDVRDFKNGLYFLQLKNNDTLETRKFSVSH